MRAAKTAGQRICLSTAQARAVPTTTGVVDRLSVRGLAAMIHDDSFMKTDRYSLDTELHLAVRSLILRIGMRRSSAGLTAGIA
jgi:hypothetical protein